MLLRDVDDLAGRLTDDACELGLDAALPRNASTCPMACQMASPASCAASAAGYEYGVSPKAPSRRLDRHRRGTSMTTSFA